ncbi:hypothetical protein K440DRAFT_79655 [Wilcoxina mikolae CBS 423.85]|nr:hypothetical protein K440DRAFT_79655 [Wilcoxina mikolae CBS 423.85]
MPIPLRLPFPFCFWVRMGLLDVYYHTVGGLYGYVLGGGVVICWRWWCFSFFCLYFPLQVGVMCARSSIYPLIRFSSLIFINYLVSFFFFLRYISFVSSSFFFRIKLKAFLRPLLLL